MRYIKINNYTYADRPNDETVYFGQDQYGRFIHQLIEDREMPPYTPLEEAVEATNTATHDFAEDYDFSVTFKDGIDHIMIDSVDFAICQQEMDFDDGRWAVQINAYFFDPADKVFRMTQFGTMPMSAEETAAHRDDYVDYVNRCMKRLLADMSIPSETVSFRIPVFKVEKA